MQQDLGKCMITSIRIIFMILAFSAWNENETRHLPCFSGVRYF